jgi:hypothetical protein
MRQLGLEPGVELVELAEGTQMVERDSGPVASTPAWPTWVTDPFALPRRSQLACRPRRSPIPPAHGPQPVFNLFRTAFDVSGAPVEVREHVMSGDRWLLTYEWAAE